MKRAPKRETMPALVTVTDLNGIRIRVVGRCTSFGLGEIASLVKSGPILIQNMKEGENSCMKKTAYVGSFIDKRSITISTKTGWL